MTVQDKFWFVWSPRGKSPKYKHPSLESAQVEARRLSQQFNGRHFYVLELVDVAIEGPEIPTPGQARRLAIQDARQTEDAVAGNADRS